MKKILFRPRARSIVLAAVLGLGLGLTATGGPAQAAPDSSAESKSCPVSWSVLHTKLVKAVAAIGSGLDNDMWAVVVNRDGLVCAVAFSGGARDGQWLLSRQIAAAKAFTANGLSLDVDAGVAKASFSTAELYPLVQPGGILFGLAEGNPLNPAAAYKGPASKFGTSGDPMVGQRVGGTITFGGGLGLYQGGTKAVGGLGLSGDTSCADDDIARELRKRLDLVLGGGQEDAITFGPRAGQHPSCG